ncbi:lectin [Pangasianodon hypophthalmus]|uniref:lectin n=1 Tax=Pangasianodon hypophthalmus TaxID=310915 RepID=UPI000EFE2F6A|nr:lectin [Pangasianodon hypophthalmus]
MDIMRTYLWLFLSLAVVEGLPVQDWVPSEGLELHQQEDLKPFFREESSVQEQPGRSNLVQEDGSFKGKSLVEPEPLGNQEEIDANKTPMQIEPVSESHLERQLCKGFIIDGKCYQFFSGPMRAYDAEFYCQNHFPNGHLASVTSSYVHGLMMLLMERNGGHTRTWIGGLRYLDTGRFIWLDGAQWNYADWLPGEPNNTAGVENCVELLSNSKFNDMPCWDLRAYICSYPI